MVPLAPPISYHPCGGNLAGSFSVHTLNFSGHGGSPFVAEPFSIQLFATEVLTFLDKKDICNINIFGYCMGGYIALYLAKFHAA